MSEFTDYLSELFSDFGQIKARKMFGGYGIYLDEIMFGLVVEDCLYLKADASNVGLFEARDLGPFVYHKAGKPVKLSYYQAPSEVLEDPEQAAIWARRSYAIAMGARKAKNKKSEKHKRR